MKQTEEPRSQGLSLYHCPSHLESVDSPPLPEHKRPLDYLPVLANDL